MKNIKRCQVGDQTILINIDRDRNSEEEKNHVLWRAETYTTKEPETLGWIDEYVKPEDMLYDIGANIGQYSLYAAKLLQGKCRVCAFEPEALNYAQLNKNILLNELSDSITAYCLAVTGQTEIGHFYVNNFAPGAALHSWNKPETQGEKEFSFENRQGMIGVSLDDLTGSFGLDFPNHIKIDVDGIEESIIYGAEKTLSDPRLRSLLIEIYIYKDTATRIHEKLQKSGLILDNADSIEYKENTVQNFIYKRTEN